METVSGNEMRKKGSLLLQIKINQLAYNHHLCFGHIVTTQVFVFVKKRENVMSNASLILWSKINY